MDKKLIDLEEKFAHLDHVVEQLNNVIFRQTQKIDELEEMIKHLSSQLELLRDNSKDTEVVSNERPPHY